MRDVVQFALTSANDILKETAALGMQLYRECTQAQRDYFDAHVKINDNNAYDMCLKTVNQNDTQWKKCRYGRITASASYALYTYSKNKKPAWNQKLESIFKSKFRGTVHTENGLKCEPLARKEYEEKTGNQIVRVGIFIHPLVPWFGCSADGVIYSPTGSQYSLWENKTPKQGPSDSTILEEATCMKKKKLKEKHPYYGQVQLGMLLFSLPHCDFTLYSIESRNVAFTKVIFDKEFCQDFAKVLTTTYFTKILPWLCKNHDSELCAKCTNQS